MNTSEQKTIIKWGIIGCGDVTEKKSGPAYQKTEGFELLPKCVEMRKGQKIMPKDTV